MCWERISSRCKVLLRNNIEFSRNLLFQAHLPFQMTHALPAFRTHTQSKVSLLSRGHRDWERPLKIMLAGFQNTHSCFIAGITSTIFSCSSDYSVDFLYFKKFGNAVLIPFMSTVKFCKCNSFYWGRKQGKLISICGLFPAPTLR